MRQETSANFASFTNVRAETDPIPSLAERANARSIEVRSANRFHKSLPNASEQKLCIRIGHSVPEAFFLRIQLGDIRFFPVRNVKVL